MASEGSRYNYEMRRGENKGEDNGGRAQSIFAFSPTREKKEGGKKILGKKKRESQNGLPFLI